MSKHTEAEKLARVWIETWNAGRPDDIPLSNDSTHSSSFGIFKGRDGCLEWVKPLSAENVTSLRIVRTPGGTDRAAIGFEMMTPKGSAICRGWIQKRDGEITAVQSFDDAADLR